MKERAREIHDGFVGKGSGPKREANIAAAARPSASVRTVGHDHHLFLPQFAKHAIAFPVLIGIQINF